MSSQSKLHARALREESRRTPLAVLLLCTFLGSTLVLLQVPVLSPSPVVGSSTSTAQPANGIKNGDFSLGLQYWVVGADNACAIPTIVTTSDDQSPGNLYLQAEVGTCGNIFTPTYSVAWVEQAVLIPPGASNVTLQFVSWSSASGAELQVLTAVGTSSFVTLTDIQVSGTQSSPTSKTYNLDAYAGNNVTFRITFQADAYGGLANIYFDDAQLTYQGGSPALTSTSVSCSPSTIILDSSGLCTATVTGFYPTGSVSWSTSGSGKFSSSTCILAAGSCSVTYTPTTPSTGVNVTASYSGDQNNLGSSGTFAVAVARSPTSTTVSCSPSPVAAGASASCSVSVSGVSPTGTVDFSSTSSTAKFSSVTCTISSGSCSVTIKDTSAGTETITAAYQGDSNNQPSNGVSSLSVSKASSSTSETCSPNPVSVGTSVACMVTVTGVTPTGIVSFSCGSSCSGAFSPSSAECSLLSGSCSISYVDNSAGIMEIIAAYGGDANNAPSSSGFTVTVAKAQTSAVVTCSQSSVMVGAGVSCSMTVNGFSPTGSVDFSSNSAGTFSPTICSLSSGSCTFQFVPSVIGTVVITATYIGDSANVGSARTFIISVVSSSTTTTTSPSTIITSQQAQPTSSALADVLVAVLVASLLFILVYLVVRRKGSTTPPPTSGQPPSPPQPPASPPPPPSVDEPPARPPPPRTRARPPPPPPARTHPSLRVLYDDYGDLINQALGITLEGGAEGKRLHMEGPDKLSGYRIVGRSAVNIDVTADSRVGIIISKGIDSSEPLREWSISFDDCVNRHLRYHEVVKEAAASLKKEISDMVNETYPDSP